MPGRASPLSSVQKACRILSVLADTPRRRLTEIATHASLNKVTTLRILDVLVKESFVRRDEVTKTYSLGDQALVLAAAARDSDDVRARARPALVRLARLSEDTVILSVRHAAESVCIDRETGSFPIRAAYIDVGARRPLGVGAGALALLAWLSDEEIDALLPQVAPRLAAYPRFSLASIRASIERARAQGYTLVLDQIVDRMGAVGVPVLGLDGRPIAALSIAALSERISSRVPELVAALKEEAARIADPRLPVPRGEVMAA
ncbi:MAG TPA: IclR family transcriptional regulator C-terminal domain-containing protein [Burkholderiales bacterium]|jgi:DNA-binding IclR family transcriptional regulator|nr:IclR family transcriptional regulator C-terminal domain-containing protein [Burkholderiales bacterium]